MQGVPEQYRSYGSGFLGRVQGGDSAPILYVSEKDQSRLYLIFASEDVSDLAFFFGIVPLSSSTGFNLWPVLSHLSIVAPSHLANRAVS